MVTKKNILRNAIIILIVLQSSCDKDRIKQKDFDLWGAYEHKDQIRLKGAFVDLKSLDDNKIKYYLFYEDGVSFGTTLSQDFIDSINGNLSSSGYFKDEYRQTYSYWGAFDIGNNGNMTIQFPKRYTPSIGDLPISEFRLEVINDTTILESGFRRNKNDEWKEYGPIEFSYIPLSIKPDSNCVLIDELGSPCCPKE